MKNILPKHYCSIVLGLLLFSQISFAQDLVVRSNDTTSNHLMVEPQNTFFGAFFGYQAGGQNIGCCNTFIGSTTGGLNTFGEENTFLGTGAGEQNVLGTGNTYLGRFAGRLSNGTRNIFLGSGAGYGFQGNDQLFIEFGGSTTPLLHGFFVQDSLVINGDLKISDDMIVKSLDKSQITGVLGAGHSADIPVELDNVVQFEIDGVMEGFHTVLMTGPVGFEIDTFTIFGNGCLIPHTGFSDEFPITFETDHPTTIAGLNAWIVDPSPRASSIIFRQLDQSETFRTNVFEFYPVSSSAGGDGRTSYTIASGPSAPLSSDNILESYILHTDQAVQFDSEYLGSMPSFDPATDKIVEIDGITHSNFTPAVQVDYAKRVITIEMTYNEGAGLLPWLENVQNGELGQRKSVTIIETTDGVTPISSEVFSNVLPFKYEVICGFGLNTKMITRIELVYGCYAPG